MAVGVWGNIRGLYRAPLGFSFATLTAIASIRPSFSLFATWMPNACPFQETTCLGSTSSAAAILGDPYNFRRRQLLLPALLSTSVSVLQLSL